jgi:hypothetical protein
MGGWCALREKCPHHTVKSGTPFERICLRGQDGVQVVEDKRGKVSLRHIFGDADSAALADSEIAYVCGSGLDQPARAHAHLEGA